MSELPVKLTSHKTCCCEIRDYVYSKVSVCTCFQVRLEPKGKFYNAFIQEVGTHSAAVTVFIEELGEK